jgi:hypothetical protein
VAGIRQALVEHVNDVGDAPDDHQHHDHRDHPGDLADDPVEKIDDFIVTYFFRHNALLFIDRTDWSLAVLPLLVSQLEVGTRKAWVNEKHEEIIITSVTGTGKPL